MDLSSIGENSAHRRHYADPFPACPFSGPATCLRRPGSHCDDVHIQD
jgi:hypothetical protein